MLTGINYTGKSTLHEEAMSSLKKFEVDLITENGISSTRIKLEPAFLAENEEVRNVIYARGT